MKVTLKDYQEDAVRNVLTNLQKAQKRWHDDGDKHAFSLTAATGAGKTVMAAAIFEALFHGDDEYDFEADPGAVVIWFSDDPSLNEQSRYRLLESADRLNLSDLHVVQNSFNREKLEAGKIYFLNTQKLGKNSMLVRGHVDSADEAGKAQMAMPDLRSFTIWDTIRNTIEDPSLTLYLLLDEAHRGMSENAGSKSKSGKPTIVKQLINGFNSIPSIPVVLGISATVERFNDAMTGMEGRATLPNVVVDSEKVQASGLLKDTIILDVPDEVGNFDTVLLRRGIDKLKEKTKAWADYAAQQSMAEPVLPLMVFQVPNKPNHDQVGRAIDTIFERWPELPTNAIAHVLGEHSTQTFGAYNVPYISPERVQETEGVRILIAKDAISTGWDCPRAEVMVSFRAASDRTHIAQLLGRMVRTPLAMRIPGNEHLNAVDCLLPHFDKKNLNQVVKSLMTGGDDGDEIPGRRVLINPVALYQNAEVTEPVWQKFDALPSQSLPKKQSRPVKRLTLLAHELAVDGLIKDAGKQAHAEMHKVLDASQVRYATEISDARKNVLTIEGKSARVDLETQDLSFDDFVEAADYAVIEDAYRRAARNFSPDLVRTYSQHLADADPDKVDEEEALIKAHVTIAALGLVADIASALEADAEKLSTKWLNAHRVTIKSMSHGRQEVYRQIMEMSADPMDIGLARPDTWIQPTSVRDETGFETPLLTFNKHLMSDGDGKYPTDFNSWEQHVLDIERAREGFVAWYRNPDRATQDSLGVAYQIGAQTKIVRPDFVFFAQQSDGSIVADIVDPHGDHLADALPKLKGLAAYAEVNSKHFRRIDAVAKVGDDFKLLDLMNASVRQMIADATQIQGVYTSAQAIPYA